MEPIHIQLPHERGNVGVLEILAGVMISDCLETSEAQDRRRTNARTLENSEVGDMTKLSLVLDQDIRCWMLWSSSMLVRKY